MCQLRIYDCEAFEEDELILLQILTTMCVDSRDDFVVYSKRTKEVSKWSKFDKIKHFRCIPEEPLDIAALKKTRWDYLFNHGLLFREDRMQRRDTKEPEKLSKMEPDESIRKRMDELWTTIPGLRIDQFRNSSFPAAAQTTNAIATGDDNAPFYAAPATSTATPDIAMNTTVQDASVALTCRSISAAAHVRDSAAVRKARQQASASKSMTKKQQEMAKKLEEAEQRKKKNMARKNSATSLAKMTKAHEKLQERFKKQIAIAEKWKKKMNEQQRAVQAHTFAPRQNSKISSLEGTTAAIPADIQSVHLGAKRRAELDEEERLQKMRLRKEEEELRIERLRREEYEYDRKISHIEREAENERLRRVQLAKDRINDERERQLLESEVQERLMLRAETAKENEHRRMREINDDMFRVQEMKMRYKATAGLATEDDDDA